VPQVPAHRFAGELGFAAAEVRGAAVVDPASQAITCGRIATAPLEDSGRSPRRERRPAQNPDFHGVPPPAGRREAAGLFSDGHFNLVLRITKMGNLGVFLFAADAGVG